MNTIINIAVLLSLFVAHILRTINQTHIFQLNSYKSNVHIKWLIKNKYNYLKTSFLYIIGFIGAFLVNKSTVCGIFIFLIFAISLFLNFPRKAKKPLVYTKRVIRLLVTNIILAIGVISLAYSFIDNFRLRYALLSAFLLISPLVLLISNLLNKPVELAINRYYINDAKKIINSHKSLITIGVTGSYGKTSVKYILGTLLEAKYNVLITPESYNTPLGVTKTIRGSLRATHDVFVCEMGAKNVGDIKEICDIVSPYHGIITSIGPQHLESFKTIDNVKKTKFELADSLNASGKLFLNGEDDNISSFSHPHPAITYGFSNNCDYYADNLSVTSSGTTFLVHCNNDTVRFNIPLIGSHNVLNVLGAIAICCELGIELCKLPAFAKKIRPVEHRLQLSRRGNTVVIDDAYNSNPSGVKAAMDVLSLFDGYKIVITPGMVELGSIQEEKNYEFGSIMASVCDFVVLVGKRQTEPIFKGLIENSFDESKIFVADNLTEAANKAFSLNVENKEKIVLFENDLPDNY